MMKNNLKLLLILLGFALPYALVYKAFFVGGPLAWGDAPYFYPDNLKELFNLPYLWNFKDNNFGAPQYYILWLYIPTYLYGLLNSFLGLGNDLLSRLIFYFPATILAIFGSWKFIGKFNQDVWSKFLGSFLYGFNTYFLMLLDGGQAGMALAYGLFPLAAFSLLSYLSKLSVKSFIFALISLFALVSADIRVALILLLFIGGLEVVRGIRGVRETLPLVLGRCLMLIIAVLGLSGYWVVPTIKAGLGGLGGVGGIGEGANFISLSNALFLFQPHFPLNQFGMISQAPFYFALVPLLLFGSLVLISKHKYALIFLIFVFLAKGGSDPLGGIYLWVVGNIPLAAAFRDSSKFYIPLLLTAGLLLSFTVSSLRAHMKGRWYLLAAISVYGYLLWLVGPALQGNLTGVLGKAGGGSYLQVYQKLKGDEGFGRSLWFRERPPLSFADWSSPALSADKLVLERPFASMNAGKYDYFNFLNSPQAGLWLKLLGVKYVFLPGDERKKVWTDEGLEENNKLLELADSLPDLDRLDLPISFPAYQVKDPLPHIFAQKKVLFVVGGEDIYDRFSAQKDYLVGQGFVFLEEGRTEPKVLEKINPGDAALVFLGSELKDLQMTFLQDKMVSPKEAALNQWLNRESSDYLTWRYDLLKQGIESKEFDYGKGVAFSTVSGEKINFNLKVPEEGNYYLAARYTNATQSAGIKLSFSGREEIALNDRPEVFRWEILGPFNSGKGELSVDLTNLGGFVMLNTLALIPEKDFLGAGTKAGDLSAKFREIKADEKLEENFLPVKAIQVNPTEYKVEDIPQDARWLVFSDHYNPGWRFKNSDSLNLPFYAMINGLYLPDSPKERTLYFSPQEDVRDGVTVSLISLGLIVSGLGYMKFLRGKGKRP